MPSKGNDKKCVYVPDYRKRRNLAWSQNRIRFPSHGLLKAIVYVYSSPSLKFKLTKVKSKSVEGEEHSKVERKSEFKFPMIKNGY